MGTSDFLYDGRGCCAFSGKNQTARNGAEHKNLLYTAGRRTAVGQEQLYESGSLSDIGRLLKQFLIIASAAVIHYDNVGDAGLF